MTSLQNQNGAVRSGSYARCYFSANSDTSEPFALPFVKEPIFVMNTEVNCGFSEMSDQFYSKKWDTSFSS